MPETGAAGVAEGLKQAVTAPQTAAKQHFWVFVAVFFFLAMVAFVILERRKAGIITRIVHGSVGRVPGVGRLVTAFALFVGLSAFFDQARARQDESSSDLQGTPWIVFGAGVLRKNSFRRKFMPLNSGSAGSTVDVPISASEPVVKVPWEIDKLVTREGNLHWYLAILWLQFDFDVEAPNENAGDIVGAQCYQLLHSYELRNKGKTGTNWAQGDTSGARAALINARIAGAYHPITWPPSTMLAGSSTGYHRQIRIPLCFAQGAWGKPQHFCPHAALMNGAMLDVYVNTNFISDVYWPKSNIKLTVVAETWGMFEALMHVPVREGRYEVVAAGKSPRTKILGMGQKGGLNGVKDSMGLAAFYLMTGAPNAGLGGVVTLDHLVRVQCDAIGLESLEYPDFPFHEFLGSIGNHVELTNGTTNHIHQFPYFPVSSAGVMDPDDTGKVLRSNALLYPFVMPGLQAELSKISKAPDTCEVKWEWDNDPGTVEYQYGTLEIGEWDPEFMVEAKKIIFGKDDADNWAWVPKLTQKQLPDEEGDYPVDAKKMKYLPHKAIRTRAK